MQISLANLAVSAYGHVKKTGILELPFFKKLFIRLYFSYKRYVEDPFYALLVRRPELLRGGNVLDIGANIGYTATLFSKYVEPGYKVYAFEPDLSNFAMLQQTIQNQGCAEQIIPIQSAVGDKDGAVTFWENEKHHADHRVLTTSFRDTLTGNFKTSEVPLVQLDSFANQNGIQSKCGFIKIDVQGFELAVCNGMKTLLLDNPKAVVAIEYMPSAISELGFNPQNLLTFFQDRNYYPYLIAPRGKLEPLDFHNLASHIPPRGYIDILFSKSEIT